MDSTQSANSSHENTFYKPERKPDRRCRRQEARERAEVTRLTSELCVSFEKYVLNEEAILPYKNAFNVHNQAWAQMAARWNSRKGTILKINPKGFFDKYQPKEQEFEGGLNPFKKND